MAGLIGRESLNEEINNILDLPPQYKYVDPIPPTESESVYSKGTTAFITTFHRATMPDWANIFDNELVPDGEMMVVTYKYNNGIQHCIQDVDMFRDGVFTTQFSRMWDYTIGEWTPLGSAQVVRTVNGVSPNEAGNVILPQSNAGQYRLDDTKTLVSFFNTFEQGTTITEIPKDSTHSTVTDIVNAYLGWTVVNSAYTFEYVLSTFIDGTVGRQDIHIYFKTTEAYQLVGHLTRGTSTTGTGWSAKWSSNVVVLNDIPNGSYAHFGMYGMIKSDPITGKLYRCTAKTTPQQYAWIEINTPVINNLTTSVVGSALDATQGKVLKDELTMLNSEIDQNLVFSIQTQEQLNTHETKIASTTQLGHVKVDGTSIVVDTNGILSAVANGSGNMTTITEEELFSADLHTNGIFFVERTIGKLPVDVESAFVKVVMHDTSAPNTKGKNYFITGLVFGEDGTTAPTYWGFQDVDISVPQNIDELNYWMPTGGTELLPKFNSHIATKASTTELGHVKIDGTSIIMDTNGVISVDLSGLNGFDVVDNFNSTSPTDALSANKGKEVYDLAVAHATKLASSTELGHVKISNQWDNPLTDTVLTLEGSTNLASAFNNEIEILNDELLSTNGQIQNTITNLSNHVNKVGSNTELGHFKVDGTTITSDTNGVLSAIIPESTETYTFDDSKHINTGKDYFIDGVTITKIPKSTTYHQSVTNLLNTQLGWTATPTLYTFDYVLHTSKNGVSGMQTLYVYYYYMEYYYLMGKLTRTTAGTSLGWSLKWTAETILLNHVPTANSEPLGMFGMLRFDTSTSKLYRSSAKTTPQPNSWFEVEPKMVNSLTQAVQGYALDAAQGYILKGLIDTHVAKIASDTTLGHVKVDGNTIEIDNNGVIGINSTNFRPNKWYVGTDRFGVTDAIDGDYYLDTITSKMYQSTDGVWEDLGGSLLPNGYKVRNNYYRETLPSTEMDVDFQVLSSDYNNSTVELYDEGIRLMESLDFSYDYDYASQLLSVIISRPKSLDRQITLNLQKIEKY